MIIDIIYMDSEEEILRVLKEKWDNHNQMQQRMAELMRRFGLNNNVIIKKMERSVGVERMEENGKHFHAVLNDTIEETANMP